MKVSALKYYFSSIPTIVTGMNFLSIPLLLVKKPVLIHLRTRQSFYVSNLMDIWTLKEVVLDRQYEKVKKCVKNKVVIDVGSSIGDFSICASSQTEHVYSYEADSERIQLMKKNIILNSCSNIDINHQKVTSLNKIFSEKKIDRCDFLKIDCEGAEYPIFKNTHDKIIKKIGHIAMEAHLFDTKMHKEYEKLLQRLRELGFTTLKVNNPVHSYIKYVYAQNKFYSM